MDKALLEQISQKFERLKKENTKEKARKYLVELGVYDKRGNLTKNYR